MRPFIIISRGNDDLYLWRGGLQKFVSEYNEYGEEEFIEKHTFAIKKLFLKFDEWVESLRGLVVIPNCTFPRCTARRWRNHPNQPYCSEHAHYVARRELKKEVESLRRKP